MTKVEWGSVITLVLAIIGGTLYLGDINGRLTALENDKDFLSLKQDKEEALEAINNARNDAINNIEAEESSDSESLTKLSNQINVLKTELEETSGRKLCYCLDARHNGSSCSTDGAWTSFKGDGRTPDRIRLYYCE